MKRITHLRLYYCVLFLYICTVNSYAYNVNEDIAKNTTAFINGAHENSESYKEEVSKTINRQININDNAVLEIKNQFGNIFITEGKNNTITFSIIITAKSTTLKGAQDIIDRINVEFSENKSKVSAETIFTNNIKGNNNGGMEINYNVTVPPHIFMQLNNKFGNIYLKDCKRDLKANVEFGDIEINSLKTNNNNIDLKFGKLKLGQAKSLNFNMAHSTSEIGNISQLNCTSAFSSIQIKSINILNCSSFKHGNITITSANQIEIPELHFSEISIDELVNKLTIKDLQFSQLKLKRIDSSFENISVFAKFSDININLSRNSSCRINFSTEMADININGFDNLKVENTDKHRFKKICSGIIGKKSNPNSYIEVTNQHANISLNKTE